MLVSNAGGQDMTLNTGRKGHVQDMYKQISNIIRQYSTLPKNEYNWSLSTQDEWPLPLDQQLCTMYCTVHICFFEAFVFD